MSWRACDAEGHLTRFLYSASCMPRPESHDAPGPPVSGDARRSAAAGNPRLPAASPNPSTEAVAALPSSVLGAAVVQRPREQRSCCPVPAVDRICGRTSSSGRGASPACRKEACSPIDVAVNQWIKWTALLHGALMRCQCMLAVALLARFSPSAAHAGERLLSNDCCPSRSAGLELRRDCRPRPRQPTSTRSVRSSTAVRTVEPWRRCPVLHYATTRRRALSCYGWLPP